MDRQIGRGGRYRWHGPGKTERRYSAYNEMGAEWEKEREDSDGERYNKYSKIRIIHASGKSLTGDGSVTARWSLIRSWTAEKLNSRIVVKIMKLNRWRWLTLMIWPSVDFSHSTVWYLWSNQEIPKERMLPPQKKSPISFPNRSHTHTKHRIPDLSSEQHLAKEGIICTLQLSVTSDSVWHLNLWKSQRAPTWSQLYLL